MKERISSKLNGNGTLDPDRSPLFQLLGLCKELVAAGVLNKMEAGLLKNWLAANRTAPAGDSIARADLLVSKMISEGKLGDSERRELLEIMEQEST